jgi:hypothetical protein
MHGIFTSIFNRNVRRNYYYYYYFDIFAQEEEEGEMEFLTNDFYFMKLLLIYVTHIFKLLKENEIQTKVLEIIIFFQQST